jgi:hypothetical protein
MCEEYPSCKQHTGPHWLFADLVDKVRNYREITADMQAVLDGNMAMSSLTVAIEIYVRREGDRLRRKEPHVAKEFAKDSSLMLRYTALGNSSTGETYEEEWLRVADEYARVSTKIEQLKREASWQRE